MWPDPEHIARRSNARALESLYANLALRTESYSCMGYFLKSDNPFILRCLVSNKNLDTKRRSFLVSSGVSGVTERAKNEEGGFRRGPLALERWKVVHSRRTDISLEGLATWNATEYGEFTGLNYLSPVYIANTSIFFLNECPKVIDPYGVEGWALLFAMAEGWSSSMKELLPVVVSILAAKKS